MKQFLPIILLVLLLFSCGAPNSKQAGETVSKPVSDKFSYVNPKIENGELRGIVELGGSGFNAFTIIVDSTQKWNLIKADFGVSKVYEDSASLASIKEGLQSYISDMIKAGVTSDQIHFMQSSTAIENPRVQEINEILEELGYQINSVTDELEAEYGYRATVPATFANESFFIDMGSGNTKIAWLEENQVKTISTYGTKYYQDSVSDETVSSELKALIAKVPERNLNKCFIIGGGPYGLAKQSDEFKERYAVLGAPESYKSDSPKAKSTINMYKAVIDASGAQFIFDWDSNFSIGFLLDK